MQGVRALAAAAALLVVAGCASASNPVASVPTVDGGAAAQTTRALDGAAIQHVIVIVQEHRSFDNLFSGYRGADTATSGQTHGGERVALKPARLDARAPLGVETDMTAAGFERAYADGKMNGFDLLYAAPNGLYPYSTVDRAQSKPYWDLAKRYALADHFFSTSTSGTFVAHQYLVAGTVEVAPHEWLAGSPNKFPWGCDAPPGTTTPVTGPTGGIRLGGPFPCFTYPSMADLLDSHHVSWKYYVDSPIEDPASYLWNGFTAIAKVAGGADWARITSPNTKILSDVRDGTLPQVSWVIPRLSDSDDPTSGGDTGPAWVTSIVDAVGKSAYWKHTAIVVVWDNSGPFYDHIPPPHLDPVSLGFRVPAIVISPYAKRGYVSHTNYEFGSILKFIEERFALGSLHATDARAASLDDCFDFTRSPKP